MTGNGAAGRADEEGLGVNGGLNRSGSPKNESVDLHSTFAPSLLIIIYSWVNLAFMVVSN